VSGEIDYGATPSWAIGRGCLGMNKKQLSERDICTKFITPSLRQAGWDEITQLREEVSFTKGRILVRGKVVTRGKAKRADYILYYKPNIPLAVIEAKDNNCSVGDGMQQALEYARTLQLPFVFSSNGDGFVFYDGTVANGDIEKNLRLDEFPSPATKVSDRDSRSTKSEFQAGDILYGKLRPYLNKVVIATQPGYSTTEIVAIRPFLPLCAAFCSIAFRRPDFVEYVTRLGRGRKCHG
jgi:type I restriction and modification enzyme subunit R-like protein